MKSFKIAAIVLFAASLSACAGFEGVSVADVGQNCHWVNSNTSSGVSSKPNAGYNTCNNYKNDSYKPGYDNYMRRRSN